MWQSSCPPTGKSTQEHGGDKLDMNRKSRNLLRRKGDIQDIHSNGEVINIIQTNT